MPATSTKQYTKQDIEAVFSLPLPELIYRAQTAHRQHHNPSEIQFCTLSSIKTGACPEDCNYCSQSARYDTGLEVEPLISETEILTEASAAKANGSTRFCMGAAWRSAPQGAQFDQVVSVVSKVRDMGLEPCVTLGMLTKEQALRLKDAGLHSYNHNIDTSPEYYSEIISTRKFEDRIETITNVQEAGIEVCCGGILGLGESHQDHISFLEVLANMEPQPSSVPINVLVPVKGTPQYDRLMEKRNNSNVIASEAKRHCEERSDEAIPIQPANGIATATSSPRNDEFNIEFLIDKFELVRTIATARILMPAARVRLSAGRLSMSEELQALCFVAGANSIHTGAKLLTTANPGDTADHSLVERLGMQILN